MACIILLNGILYKLSKNSFPAKLCLDHDSNQPHSYVPLITSIQVYVQVCL